MQPIANDPEFRAAEIKRIAEDLTAAKHWVSPDRRVNEKTAAYFLGISIRHLRKLREQDRAPDFAVIGRLTYSIADLLDYIASRTYRSSKSLAASGTDRKRADLCGKPDLSRAA